MKPNKIQFLDPSAIDRGIAEVAELAAAQGVHVALIGGAALQLLGSNRFTNDIDFITDALIEGIEVHGSLAFGGVQGATPSGTAIDLVLRSDTYQDLYEAALYHAERVEGVPVHVVTAEFLVAMKMVAGRRKDDADLEFLIADSDVDFEAARKIVAVYLGPYAADEFDSFRDEIEWRRQREPR